jgi:hypothetical protein
MLLAVVLVMTQAFTKSLVTVMSAVKIEQCRRDFELAFRGNSGARARAFLSSEVPHQCNKFISIRNSYQMSHNKLSRQHRLIPQR